MLGQLEVDALSDQAPLVFGHTLDTRDPHWAWTSFRGTIEAFVERMSQMDWYYRPQVTNDVALPTCQIERHNVRDGVYEACLYNSRLSTLLFLWTIPQYVDEYGLPLRRGVLVFPRDLPTVRSVGEAYTNRLLYL